MCVWGIVEYGRTPLGAPKDIAIGPTTHCMSSGSVYLWKGLGIVAALPPGFNGVGYAIRPVFFRDMRLRVCISDTCLITISPNASGKLWRAPVMIRPNSANASPSEPEPLAVMLHYHISCYEKAEPSVAPRLQYEIIS